MRREVIHLIYVPLFQEILLEVNRSQLKKKCFSQHNTSSEPIHHILKKHYDSIPLDSVPFLPSSSAQQRCTNVRHYEMDIWKSVYIHRSSTLPPDNDANRVKRTQPGKKLSNNSGDPKDLLTVQDSINLVWEMGRQIHKLKQTPEKGPGIKHQAWGKRYPRRGKKVEKWFSQGRVMRKCPMVNFLCARSRSRNGNQQVNVICT